MEVGFRRDIGTLANIYTWTSSTTREEKGSKVICLKELREGMKCW